MDKLAEKNNIEVPDLSDNPLISNTYCAIACHQKLGVDVPAKTVIYQKKIMPHKSHIEDMGLKCNDCHVFGLHKEVKLKEPKICSQCH